MYSRLLTRSRDECFGSPSSGFTTGRPLRCPFVSSPLLVLQDGTVLYGLLEVLSKQSLAVLGKVKPEKNKIKKIANMNIVWK